MSFNIENNYQQINDSPRAQSSAGMHGNLESREVRNMTGSDGASLERIDNTRKRMDPHTSSRPQRRKLDTDPLNEYFRAGKTLSNSIYRLDPLVQKEKLSMIAETDSHAGYLLATILLQTVGDEAVTNKAISLLKNYLNDVHAKFGEIGPDSKLAVDYFYVHYLLGKYLNKGLCHDVIKVHLSIASTFLKYRYIADLEYGDVLLLEGNQEESIQHWQKMIDYSKQPNKISPRLGYLYNRLGCSFVEGEMATIENLEKGIKAFEIGMMHGDQDATDNWHSYKNILSANGEKSIEDYHGSASQSEIDELGSFEARSASDNQIHHLILQSNCASQQSENCELSLEIQSIDHEEPPQPISKQAQEILDLLKESASYGNADAIQELAVILTEGKRGIPANLEEALPYWDELAKLGQSAAYMKQADIFENLAKTSPEPLQWITKAINAIKSFKVAEPDSTENANKLLGDLLYRRAEIFLNQNLPAAGCIIESLKESAGYGNLEALKKLAHFLTEGHGTIQQNLKEALPYWEELARRGESSAYLKQVEILEKTEQKSLDLIEKILQLLKLFKEAKPENGEAAKSLLGSYLFKKAQILLNS